MGHGWNSTHFFDQHLTDFCSVGSRATSEQTDMRGLHECGMVEPHSTKAPGAHLAVNAPGDALAERVGLFVDFFVHVVGCIAKFSLAPRIFQHRDAGLNAFSFH